MPLGIVEQHAASITRDALDLRLRTCDPARVTRSDPLEARRGAVLVLEPVEHDVELKHAYGADDRRRARRFSPRGEEHLRSAFFGELPEPGVELLPLHRIGEHDAREMLRREPRDARELEVA